MMIPKWNTTATLAVLLALGVALATQGNRPEWKIVPVLAPGSHFSDDGFSGKIVEAQNAAIAAKDAQDGLNAKITEQFNKMDMSEKAQRMQAWMMKNPQAASKLLEASSDAGGAAAVMAEIKAAGDRLDGELGKHKTAFDAAVDRAVKPVDAKVDALMKTRTRKTKVSSVFLTEADYTAYAALMDERNAAYEKASSPFFGAGGAFHKWLADYRAEVTEKALAAGDKGDAMYAQQFAIMDTPAGGYRTSSGYDVIREYLRRFEVVAGYRAYKVKPDPVLKPAPPGPGAR
jgi:hypothetical protein